MGIQQAMNWLDPEKRQKMEKIIRVTDFDDLEGRLAAVKSQVPGG
jgi:hypothetical protein